LPDDRLADTGHVWWEAPPRRVPRGPAWGRPPQRDEVAGELRAGARRPRCRRAAPGRPQRRKSSATRSQRGRVSTAAL